ncbi:MAG TPA: MarR family winged helix-turn-helix transcriptional regulator [Pseudonocardia sp.]|jgi:DNA-binding MarR family transcriptional regulator
MTSLLNHRSEPHRRELDDNSLTSTFALASHLLELRLDQALSGQGITARQYRALRHIADEPGVTRVDLASFLRITPQAAGGLSQRLHDAGLIERSLPVGGLPISFTITDQGRTQLARAAPVVMATERETLAKLPSGTVESLVGAMRELLLEIA